jgi:hypothetical protein
MINANKKFKYKDSIICNLIMSSLTKPLRGCPTISGNILVIRRLESILTLIFTMNPCFPPNLRANKVGFKQFIYNLWEGFPDIRINFELFQ